MKFYLLILLFLNVSWNNLLAHEIDIHMRMSRVAASSSQGFNNFVTEVLPNAETRLLAGC